MKPSSLRFVFHQMQYVVKWSKVCLPPPPPFLLSSFLFWWEQDEKRKPKLTVSHQSQPLISVYIFSFTSKLNEWVEISFKPFQLWYQKSLIIWWMRYIYNWWRTVLDSWLPLTKLRFQKAGVSNTNRIMLHTTQLKSQDLRGDLKCSL